MRLFWVASLLAASVVCCPSLAAGQHQASQASDVVTYGARCDGTTDDTKAIVAAVAAVAAEGAGGVLRFQNMGGPCVSNSFAVPANVTTRFEGSAALYLNSGQTATFSGPIEATPARHFRGPGRVSFDGNSLLREVYVTWWIESSEERVDRAEELQRVAAAMRSGMRLIWPAGTSLYLNGPVTFAHLKNFRLGGVNRVGDDTVGAARIILGPKGTIIWDCVRGSAFENLYVLSNGNDNALQLDQLTSTGGGDLSSDNTIEGNNFTNVSTNPRYTAIRIANSSATNNEFHRILSNSFHGHTQTYGARAGTAIQLGHSNVKNVVIETNNFSGLSKSIASSSGSFRARNNRHASVDVCYYGSFSDAVYIIGDDSEGATQVLDAEGFGVVPVFIMGGRFNDLYGATASTVGPNVNSQPVFNVRNSIFLSVVNCQFAPIRGQSFGPGFVTDATRNAMSLVWLNNYVMGISAENLALGLSTFKSVNGMTSNAASGISANPVAYPGLDTFLSTGAQRPLIRVANDTVQLGEGELALLGLSTPTNFVAAQRGRGGSTQHIFRLLARDANGNRTVESNESNVTNSHAMLSATDYIQAAWTPVPLPAGGGYDIIERDLKSGLFRLVASPGVSAISNASNTSPIVIHAEGHGLRTGDEVYISGVGGNTAANNSSANPRWSVTVLSPSTFSLDSSSGNGTYASGGTVNPVSFRITANPAGALDYRLPGYNETGGVRANGPIVQGIVVTFGDGASTPSVARSNYFRTSNTNPTIITNFSQGRDGQLIVVLVDANTGIANNAYIKTRTGAAIQGAANLTHSFLRISGVWYQQN